MSAKFVLYQDDNGYHFELIAANGESVAGSQSYQSVADAQAGMSAVQRAAAEATIPDDAGGVTFHEGIHMHFVKRPQ